MMPLVLTTNIPTDSIYKKYISKIDFHDTYSVRLVNTDMSIEAIYFAIFSHMPTWIENLFRFRNMLVSVFGLKTGGDKRQATIENVKVGEKVGLFRIYEITDSEIISGEDDKHLNFRVSVLKHDDKLFVTTLVQYNNLFGRIYMTIIMPFHKLVVKAMLKNALQSTRI